MKKLIFIPVFVLLSFAAVVAQQEIRTTETKLPTLNGHTFPTIAFVRTSFVSTNLLTTVGVGSTTVLRIPGFDIEGHEIPPFEGNILFLNMRIKYQQQFTPWLAMYFSLNVAGRLGTDLTTILADGVNTMSGGDIGWLVRILNKDKFNLSGTINVKNLNGNFINVSQFIEDLINDVPNASITKKIPAMSIGPGIQGAYAFNPTFGLQFYGEYAYGESFERDVSKGYFLAGIAGDVDFKLKQRDPLGLALGYTITSAPEIVMNDADYANLLMAKLGYTGSRDYELGVQYAYYNVKITEDLGKTDVSSFMLILKFYF